MQKLNDLSQRFTNQIVKTRTLAPVLFALCWFMFTWFISRSMLLIGWPEQALKEPQLHLIFPISLRFDFLTFSYGIGGFLLLCLATPTFVLRRAGMKFWGCIIAFFYGVIVFLEIAAWPFLREYGNRPDRHAIEFWKTPKEVINMLAKGFGVEIFLALALSLLLAVAFFKMWKQLMSKYRPFYWPLHIISWVVLLGIFIIGGRSSLGHRPANISSASFSQEHIVNQLTLNSAYSFAYAAYRMRHEENSTAMYGKRDSAQMLTRLKKLSMMDGKQMPTDLKQWHWKMDGSGTPVKNPPNIFIVAEESLGAEFVGALGGSHLTPHLEQQAKKGLFFTNLYSTGTRTARGLEALITGFPPTPATSVLKLGKSYNSFFSLAKALKPFGYKSYFFSGGDGNFDEMKSFFMSNGFDRFFDRFDLQDKYEAGSWGIHDGDLLEFAHNYVTDHQGPFLAVVLSSSNHSPFDYPVGEFQPDPNYPKESHPNAVLYSDFSLGKWFKNLESSSYRDNTLFLVVADHGTRVYGDKLVPIYKFHIPGLMWGPGVPVGTYDKIASQIDLPTTLLGLTGLPIKSPMLGFNLFKLPADYPGRALLQYHDHLGYLVGDRFVVLRPQQEAEVFRYHQGQFTPLAPNSDEIEDTMAYSLGTWELYNQQLYK